MSRILIAIAGGEGMRILLDMSSLILSKLFSFGHPVVSFTGYSMKCLRAAGVYNQYNI
jgi:hypothetical protein